MEKSKIGIIAAACGGLAGGALLGAPLLTSASTPDTTPSTTTPDTVDATTDTTTGDTTTSDTGTGDTATNDRSRRERARGDGCRGGRGEHERRRPGLFLERGAVAELLGLEPDVLRQRLRDGETIADIATAEGLDPQDVIDTLVEEAQANLDERVAERSERLEDRITDLVNGDVPD